MNFVAFLYTTITHLIHILTLPLRNNWWILFFTLLFKLALPLRLILLSCQTKLFWKTRLLFCCQGSYLPHHTSMLQFLTAEDSYWNIGWADGWKFGVRWQAVKCRAGKLLCEARKVSLLRPTSIFFSPKQPRILKKLPSLVGLFLKIIFNRRVYLFLFFWIVCCELSL